jgi:hypothetical protein
LQVNISKNNPPNQQTRTQKSYSLLIKPRSPAKPNKMKLLCLSNGHGEDGIGAKIALQLQQLTPPGEDFAQDPTQIRALPMVGLGQAYTQAGFPLLLPGQVMPSGGFLNMDSKELLRDLRQGLLPLAWQQLNYCRAWARAGGKILAVGDIVPLLFAWLSGGITPLWARQNPIIIARRREGRATISPGSGG